MATRQRRATYDALTPEQKAEIDAHRAGRDAPGVREAEVRDREAILEERRTTGTVMTTGDPAWPDDETRLLRFLASLKARREAEGLSLADIAERSEIDQAALSRLENGRGNPTARTLSRYCHALGGRICWGFEVVTPGSTTVGGPHDVRPFDSGKHADEFEARIRADKINGATEITLIFHWFDERGREVAVRREPVEMKMTMKVEGSPSGHIRPFAESIYVGTIVDSMRSMVLGAPQHPTMVRGWPDPVSVREIELEIIPA